MGINLFYKLLINVHVKCDEMSLDLDQLLHVFFGSQNGSSVTLHLSFVNFTVYNFFAFEINTTISV